jgi:hypothetical protein
VKHATQRVSVCVVGALVTTGLCMSTASSAADGSFTVKSARIVSRLDGSNLGIYGDTGPRVTAFPRSNWTTHTGQDWELRVTRGVVNGQESDWAVIRNLKSDQCMEPEGTNNGDHVQVAKCDGTDKQKWGLWFSADKKGYFAKSPEDLTLNQGVLLRPATKLSLALYMTKMVAPNGGTGGDWAEPTLEPAEDSVNMLWRMPQRPGQPW